MLWIRYAKISLVATTCLFLCLVVFGNTTDYGSNFNFVKNVLSMTDTFEGNRLMYRAITHPVLHHIFYLFIILWEAAGAWLTGLGVWRLWKAAKTDAASFQQAKSTAIIGLVLTLQLWFLAFMTVGGQWFVMWQSDQWNGQDASTRLFLIMGVSLIFLYLRDDELESSPAPTE